MKLELRIEHFKVGQLGGREGKEQQGDKREVVIGRRGKAWVPWEQLWQVGIINLETAIKKIKDNDTIQ